MGEDWQPITRNDFDELLALQTAALSSQSREHFERYRVEPFKAIIRRSEQYGDESVWVVARADMIVVFFDDVEYEFAVGRIDDCRILFDGYMGDLTDAMYGFPDNWGPQTR
jgi:hypothetical protein